MLLHVKPRFSPLREAVLRERSRPPQGTPAPETASARSPRPLAVTPPPAPAPPAPATPRGPPPKSAARASPAKNPGLRGTYVPSWRPPRPEKRLHPREGGLKFGQKCWFGRLLRRCGAAGRAPRPHPLSPWASRRESSFSPPRFFDDFSLHYNSRSPIPTLFLLGAGPASRCPRAARTPLLRAPALRESDPEAGPAPGARGRNCGAELPHTAAPSRPL